MYVTLCVTNSIIISWSVDREPNLSEVFIIAPESRRREGSPHIFFPHYILRNGEKNNH